MEDNYWNEPLTLTLPREDWVSILGVVDKHTPDSQPLKRLWQAYWESCGLGKATAEVGA